MLDGIVVLNLLEDFRYGPVTAVLMALSQLAYERCETSQPFPRVLPLLVTHKFENALLVGLSADPRIFFVRLVTFFE